MSEMTAGGTRPETASPTNTMAQTTTVTTAMPRPRQWNEFLVLSRPGAEERSAGLQW
jgi:hypothetical protein